MAQRKELTRSKKSGAEIGRVDRSQRERACLWRLKIRPDGAIADSVLEAHGEVIGVEPEFFIKDEFQHEGLTKLIVTKDMFERKSKMIELGDVFIAFPGGTGTLEEITEVMSKVSLRHLNAPCIL